MRQKIVLGATCDILQLKFSPALAYQKLCYTDPGKMSKKISCLSFAAFQLALHEFDNEMCYCQILAKQAKIP